MHFTNKENAQLKNQVIMRFPLEHRQSGPITCDICMGVCVSSNYKYVSCCVENLSCCINFLIIK